MSVILLTVFVGIILAACFIVLFLYHEKTSTGGNEHRALMPLDEERSQPARSSNRPTVISKKTIL